MEIDWNPSFRISQKKLPLLDHLAPSVIKFDGQNGNQRFVAIDEIQVNWIAVVEGIYEAHWFLPEGSLR